MQKVVLITGASSGLGKSIALYLSSKGHIVYGTSRKALEEEDFRMLRMDVTSRKAVREGINTIIEEQGRIDVLINNAGMGIGGALELTMEEEISIQINTNLIGVINVCSEVLPYMRENGGGRIINVSSVGGVMGLPYQGLYSASKFAVEGYSETLSLEVKRFNIKVVLVEPGDFSTGFTASRINSEATMKSDAYKDSFIKTLKVIEKEEMNGLKPIVLAKKVNAVIRMKRPKFRYVVANPIQKLSVFAKKILPARMFHRILKLYYKM
jgi:NAD(P)-dependent dehydrogenase (short-subunit alcohol dehydrogenase family)